MIDPTTEMLDAQEARLRAVFRELGSCIVAFSGGVDSALVLHVAAQELGERAVGITARSESLAEREYAGAVQFAGTIEARHEVVARERGIPHIVDGYNRDDEGDWRPGRQAAREHAVRSPLYEAGLRKADVRALARKLGLEVWDKPALACLSSRFPYGTPITLELLRQVDRAEQAVHDAGLRACRVRHHGEIARIEVPPDEIAAAAEPERRARIVAGVRAAGYRYVTLDLGGYISGGFNLSP